MTQPQNFLTQDIRTWAEELQFFTISFRNQPTVCSKSGLVNSFTRENWFREHVNGSLWNDGLGEGISILTNRLSHPLKDPSNIPNPLSYRVEKQTGSVLFGRIGTYFLSDLNPPFSGCCPLYECTHAVATNTFFLVGRLISHLAAWFVGWSIGRHLTQSLASDRILQIGNLSHLRVDLAEDRSYSQKGRRCLPIYYHRKANDLGEFSYEKKNAKCFIIRVAANVDHHVWAFFLSHEIDRVKNLCQRCNLRWGFELWMISGDA